MIEFIPGSTGVVIYNLEFNNSDSTNFTDNSLIIFDGKMRLNSEHTFNMIKDESWLEDGELYLLEFDYNNYSKIDKFN